MKNSFLLAPLAALIMASCAKEPATDYYVRATFAEQDNNLMAYIVDYDTNDKIDSAVIDNGIAVFNGNIEKPVLARLLVTGGQRRGNFVLEADSINIENREAKGGKLNAVLDDFFAAQNVLEEQYKALPDTASQEQKDQIVAAGKAAASQFVAKNSDNPAGYYIFLSEFAYDLTLQQLNDSIAKYPALDGYKRIADLKTALVNKAETGEGAMFKDFEISHGDSIFRLSEHVGKGHYVLVDFWASWCPPCMREIEVIRGIHKEFAPKGLEVIGVAVWDKVEDTKKAVETKQIPWTIVYDAQKIPTDIYGISGIPCIILFAPDGKIILRDKYGDDLISGITAVFNE